MINLSLYSIFQDILVSQKKASVFISLYIFVMILLIFLIIALKKHPSERRKGPLICINILILPVQYNGSKIVKKNFVDLLNRIF